MTNIEYNRIFESFKDYVESFPLNSITYNCIKVVEIYPIEDQKSLQDALQSIVNEEFKLNCPLYHFELKNVISLLSSGGNDYDVGINIEIPIPLNQNIRKWDIYFFKSRSNLVFGIHTFEISLDISDEIRSSISSYKKDVLSALEKHAGNPQFKHNNLHIPYWKHVNEIRNNLFLECLSFVRSYFPGLFTKIGTNVKNPIYDFFTIHPIRNLKNDFSFKGEVGSMFIQVLDLRHTDKFIFIESDYFISRPFYSEYLHYTFLSEDVIYKDTNVNVNPFFEWIIVDVLMNLVYQKKQHAIERQWEIDRQFTASFKSSKIIATLNEMFRENFIYSGVLNEIDSIISTIQERSFKKNLSPLFKAELKRLSSAASDLNDTLVLNIEYLNRYISTNGSAQQATLNERMLYLTITNVILVIVSLMIALFDKIIIVFPSIWVILKLLANLLNL